MPDIGLSMESRPAAWISSGPNDTFRWGRALGATAPHHGTIALSGPLGAGKTRFVQGLAAGLGIPSGAVSSPTYVLVHLHEGRLPLCHVDLYRLEDPEALATLGLEDLLEGEGIAAIEWAEKGLDVLPPHRLNIAIHILEGDRREMVVAAADVEHQRWIDRALRSADFSQDRTSAEGG